MGLIDRIVLAYVAVDGRRFAGGNSVDICRRCNMA